MKDDNNSLVIYIILSLDFHALSWKDQQTAHQKTFSSCKLLRFNDPKFSRTWQQKSDRTNRMNITRNVEYKGE